MLLTKEASVVLSDIYKLVGPKHNIRLQIDGEIAPAALIKRGFTPAKDDAVVPRRDSVTESGRPTADLKPLTGKFWNLCQQRPTLKVWKDIGFPKYAVMQDEARSKVFSWMFATALAFGSQICELPVLGFLGDPDSQGVYAVNTGTFKPEVLNSTISTISTLAIDKMVVKVDSTAQLGYTGDPFSVDSTAGHYVGQDGFHVPKDFGEFYDRFPKYISNWVRRHLSRNVIDEDVEDWTQELIIHMQYLPARSKFRLQGMEDVIQTFDPVQQYGASERRFRHYINFCLLNKFSTIHTKRNKNPICRQGNYTLDTSADSEYTAVVDDEWVHTNSDALSKHADNTEKRLEDTVFKQEFYAFIEQEDPEFEALLAVAESIQITGTLTEAAEHVKMNEPTFNRHRNRLKQLGKCFCNDYWVPRQRKPYKKRIVIPTESAAAAAV